MQLKQYLENAHNIKFDLPHNELWSAGFSMPFGDPKIDEIEAYDFVEMFDNGKRVGMFRVLDNDLERNGEEINIKYECEHVLSTLLDGMLLNFHQRTNRPTRENIEYVLSYQYVKHWVLGICEFTRYFHYGWENENTLLGPLFSIPKQFNESYQWTFDDSVYPWVLNIVKVTDEITAEIRYKKNMLGIRRRIDPKGVITRIAPKGYGEGVNQLNIKKVNPTGKEYIDAPQGIIDKFGIIAFPWVDRKFKHADSLYNSGYALLMERCIPKVTYEVDAIDYELIDPYKLEKFENGKLVRVIDEDLGIHIDVRVLNRSKPDSDGDPLNVKLVLGNKKEDLGTTQADLEKRQQINEVYSQGSTNLLAYSYNDNADSMNPAVIRFFVPGDMINVNTLDLTFEVEEFRNYLRVTQGGGATVQSTGGGGAIVASTGAGGGTVQSTGGGGGTVQSTGGGGAQVSTSTSGGEVSKSTESGGGSSQTSGGGGGTTQTTSSKIFGELVIECEEPGPFTNIEHHRHVTKFTDQFDHLHQITIGSHTHTVLIPAHSHNFNVPSHSHQITLNEHTHQIVLNEHTHQIVLNDHIHQIELKDHVHEIILPDHVHEVEHGIYRLSRRPSKVTIKVDGNLVPFDSTSGQNIDLISYLSKDDEGKIERNKFHEITITPDDLGRVNANIITRLFISSTEGGNF